MWKEYLKSKIIEENDILKELYNIDNNVQGTSYSIRDLLSYLEDKKYQLLPDDLQKDTLFVLDGNPNNLINLIGQFYQRDYKVNIIRTNLAINKWIVKKYQEFSEQLLFDKTLTFTFKDNFNSTKNQLVLIGNKSFVEELSNCSKVPCLKIYTEDGE